MKRRRAGGTRQQPQEESIVIENADHVLRSADAVLSVDLSSIQPGSVRQFAVGWLRAAFEQSRAIAKLTTTGLGYLAAPNKRVFWELALRLLWLESLPQHNRAEAAETMLAKDRWSETKTLQYLQELELQSDIDAAAMKAVLLNETSSKKLREQARNVAEAAKSIGLNGARIYQLWRQDSTWTHASGFLAGYHAPSGGSILRDGKPPNSDPDLEIHRLVSALMVFTVSRILREEGVERELAIAPMIAFFEVK